MKNKIKYVFFAALLQLIPVYSWAILPEYKYHRTVRFWKSMLAHRPKYAEEGVFQLRCDGLSFIDTSSTLLVGCSVFSRRESSRGHFFELDAETGLLTEQVSYPKRPVEGLSLPSKGTIGAWIDGKGDVSLTDFSDFSEIQKLPRSTPQSQEILGLPCVIYSSDGSVFGIAGLRGDIVVWNSDTSPLGDILKDCPIDPNMRRTFFGFSPGGKVALSHVNGQLVTFDVKTGAALAKTDLKLLYNGFAMWTPDGERIVLVNDNEISILDPKNLETISRQSIPLLLYAVSSPVMAISKDSSLLAVTLSKRRVGVYELPSLKIRQILTNPPGGGDPAFFTLAFSRDDQYLAVYFRRTAYQGIGEKDLEHTGVHIWKLTEPQK